MYKMRTGMMLGVACLTAAALWVGCDSGASQSTQAPSTAVDVTAGAPAVDGATLLETRCSVCHSTDKIKNTGKTRDQWDQTVSRMVNRGAQLTDAEKTTLVDYLAANFAP